MTYNISERGQDFIKSFEALRLQAYDDGEGIPTIGYGHTRDVRMGDVVTRQEAERLFQNDIGVIWNSEIVPQLESRNIVLTQNQIDAVASLAFNVGSDKFLRSGAFQALVDGDFVRYLIEASEFRNPGRPTQTGLERRRADEVEMFVDGEYRREDDTYNPFAPGNYGGDRENPEFPDGTRLPSGSCFARGTPISVGLNGETRPIEEIAVGDEVVSYDAAGQLVTSTVTAIMQNEVACVLDWFGTGVTPGHVTLCAVVDGEEHTPAGRLARPRNANDSLVGRHVPLIDILCADGAVMKQDGTLVRAATDEVVGSRADAFVRCRACLTGEDLKAGRYVEGQMRAGTKLITGEGNTVSVLETIEANGYAFDAETGLVTKDGATGPMPFFGALPKPEDYVLRCSGLTLEAIQAANEWEGGQRPAIAPAAMAGTAPASSNLNRKQRRAMKAKSKGRPARMH